MVSGDKGLSCLAEFYIPALLVPGWIVEHRVIVTCIHVSLCMFLCIIFKQSLTSLICVFMIKVIKHVYLRLSILNAT